jgi:hypothetical protein
MKYFLFLFLLLPFILHAQKATDQKSYAKTITAEDLKKHLFIVADKEMEGRGTATRGEQRAATYIERHFKSLGLTPGNNGNFLMPFPVYRDTYSGAMELNGKALQWGSDFTMDVSGYSSTMLFGESVYLGAFIPDSTQKVMIMDRLVIVSGYPAVGYAVGKGAAAVLMVLDEELPLNLLKWTSSERWFREIVGPNLFYISKDVANQILNNKYEEMSVASRAAIFKPVVFKADIKLQFNMNSEKIYGNNVISYIEGTDKKDEYVFITAHYDHEGIKRDSVIYYGADDDGSGTVTILELAEAFAKAKAEGKGPRRSIVFMTVSGEEKGLWGSKYYSDHPIFPLDKTTVDLNIDMVGRIDQEYKGDSLNYLYIIGEGRISTELKTITDAVNKKYCGLELDRKFNAPNHPDRFYFRSDHYNFARKGVPVLFYFNGTHKDYHQPTDTPDKINYTLLEKRARFIFHTAWEIANRDNMLKRNLLK